jgi:hypothetical protein
MEPRIFLGPMSKNIIDSIIRYANKHQIHLGLIPSRRQSDHDYSYTGFNTAQLHYYVSGGSDNILLQRDHGGPKQGIVFDEGHESLKVDSKYFNIIHIDPFKVSDTNMEKAALLTTKYMEYVLFHNPDMRFEVGTEEAIFKYQPSDLDYFLGKLHRKLGKTFSQIDYAVVQSGTGLDLGNQTNTGVFDVERLKKFIEVCNFWGVRSKEHNGDFLTEEGIAQRFQAGLSGLNVAPELGIVETETILQFMNESQKEEAFNLALTIDNWRKWIPEGFNLQENRDKIILISGHYLSNNSQYKELLSTLTQEYKKSVMDALESRIDFLVKSSNGY